MQPYSPAIKSLRQRAWAIRKRFLDRNLGRKSACELAGLERAMQHLEGESVTDILSQRIRYFSRTKRRSK